MVDDWRPYVTAAERRRNAARKLAELRKNGCDPRPIEISGRKITTTFWGNAWCDNLEKYSDFANRLPRGRTYVRNGSVIDLKMDRGQVTAMVSGTEIYDVTITIKPLSEARWEAVKSSCAGRIDSIVELLAGKLEKGVMQVVTQPGTGLFPVPKEIELDCSCPDWALMCKHIAAALYGVGALLDSEPELLFKLRGVDPAELIDVVVKQPAPAAKPGRARRLQSDDMSALFGIDLGAGGEEKKATANKAVAKKEASPNKAVAKKKTVKRKISTSSKKAVTKKTVKRKISTSSKKAVTKKAVKRKTAAKKKISAKKAVAKKTVKRRTVAKKKPSAREAVANKTAAAKKTGRK